MGTLASNNVLVKKASLIPPSDPTPTHILKLSSIDSQLFLRFTIEYLLIYPSIRSNNTFDQAAFTGRVKAALGRALIPYYPLSGRVRARPDNSCLEVICRGQGALFIEAESEFNVTDFENAPRYVTEWRKLLALELSNGCLSRKNTSDLKPKPVWQRSLLDPTSFKKHKPSLVSHPEFNQVNDYCNFMTRFNPDKLTPTSVTFHEWKLNELKNSVTRSTRTSQLTSFEVLSAHIWRTWAKALHFPPSQTLKLLFSINIRHRVKPSLPGGYYGNAIVLGCAQTTVKELTENGLVYATELIKEAKNRVDDKFVKEVVNSVSLKGPSCVPDSVGVLILSQWSKLGLESVDFGIGRPVQVGPVCTDRYCILLPVHDQSRSIKVMLAVPSVAVDKYVDLITAVD
ncbi:Chloramphenicol acetyltransferase-like domain-containing protein [Artemisia annua]|uniref:Chloramphenicol acetyltransferase-like domain-containing protein n=1 Tax=Artemisia annua TaxID=35608 RepID=A0A2U1NZL6_ARTAN|nr:Chloramphenicol acetyltransferase-like domain-containing protein [Artemisia annua]